MLIERLDILPRAEIRPPLDGQPEENALPQRKLLCRLKPPLMHIADHGRPAHAIDVRRTHAILAWHFRSYRFGHFLLPNLTWTSSDRIVAKWK